MTSYTPVIVVEAHSKASMFKAVNAPPPRASTPEEEQGGTTEAPDEAPQVVSMTEDLAPPPPPKKKPRGGLQSAASLAAENAERRARAEAARKEAEAARAAAAGDGEGEETVYRDAEGKRIDTKAEKAKQKRAREKQMEKEMERMEWGKGLVQREDKEARKRELDEIAAKPMARYISTVSFLIIRRLTLLRIGTQTTKRSTKDNARSSGGTTPQPASSPKRTLQNPNHLDRRTRAHHLRRIGLASYPVIGGMASIGAMASNASSCREAMSERLSVFVLFSLFS
jgi:chemotaxis protein histidine kinase CheA